MPHTVRCDRRFSPRPKSLARIAHRLAEIARIRDLYDPFPTRKPDLPENLLHETARVALRPTQLSPFLPLTLFNVNFRAEDVSGQHSIRD